MPGNRTTTLNYNAAGDLVKVIDPLGNDASIATDDAGRPVLSTDALGFNTQPAYNAVDQLSKITDANAGVTQFNYDTKRNLASVVNPLNNTIEAYQYDNLNRLTQKTDAKLKSTAYQYDGAGNLTQMTDRKGQVTTLTYDAQNRITSINFPGGATQTRTYDTIGRLSEIREPDNAMTYSYDTVDRLTTVATDSVAGHHEIDYTYDALDRVVSRTVDGADATAYTYDPSSRLATISYRNQITTYTWDNSNRLTGKTLVSLGVGLLFALALLWMFGSYGGIGWWLFLAVLALVVGCVSAFFMWFVFKSVYAIDEPQNNRGQTTIKN